uniref:Dynein heavy chain tail domain-containing protein n=1 Tax=Parascaris equorum TaxID=6256 RepID=A0A914R7T0_PAREQ
MGLLSWCREITESIDEQSDPIALQTTGKLMSIEKKYGTLNVNYSDRLVKLLREKLIIDGKKGDTAMATVTWDNPAKLQEFIERLQEAAQRLTVRNRKLRKAHSEICEKVIELMNLDLLKEVNKWKDIMLEIRAKFAEQERYAGSKSNMRAWIVHWDRQIYKVKIFA